MLVEAHRAPAVACPERINGELVTRVEVVELGTSRYVIYHLVSGDTYITRWRRRASTTGSSIMTASS